ncbi:MAG: M23 family metallopeptidase [Dehalococcoidia bacterium]|nr:M23 family metallopeptidase [Dehalococcoidia bacterium]
MDRIWPVSQGFGENPATYPEYGGHPGIDIACPTGTIVTAACDGVVLHAGLGPPRWLGRGIYVTLGHGTKDEDLESNYMHLSAVLCERGDMVKAGDPIGLSGNTGWSTGAHCHFDLRRLGVPLDPATVGLL